MFTGLIEELGIIRSVVKSYLSASLTIQADRVAKNTELGASVAVNGACLTITGITGNSFDVDVMAETLVKTNLGMLHEGSRVNLERALKVGDRLDGHFVTGHVDATGTVLDRRVRGIAAEVRIGMPKGLEQYFIPQGSVALNGVSLTIASLEADTFSISLIPHTQKITTLGNLRVGDLVNIETDVLGKYVNQLLRGHREKQGVTTDFLKEQGFF